ncbi:Fimbrillin-like [Prevotella sp. khp7]|nr:Fimbrillin-like [Prevotella sp. khp7]
MMAAMVLLPASCIEDSMDKSATGEGMVPINLTISPKAVSTRTATTDIQSVQLASGQTFYAYFTSTDVVPRSTTFTADGAGGTTPASQPYFKLSETSTGVRAYYPSSVTEETTSFTVEANQSGDDAYRASDLMFASANITKVFPASTGALTFAHKMAKIKVTTTTRVSSIKTIKLKGILPTVPFNASDGTLGTASGSATDITMYSHSGQTANINCVALIPPQSKAADATLIEVTSALHSSTPLTYKLPNAITFQSGLQYIFNVDLHEEQIVVTYTVSPWSSTTTNSAAVDVYRNKYMNPLYYVAENNVKSYNSSTKVVTLETNPAATGSSYCYKWSDAMGYFAYQGAPYDTYWGGDITDGTTGFKYHLPCRKEWFSMLPSESNVFTTDFMPSGGLVSSAQTCIFGYNDETKTGVDDWSYWSTYTASSNVRYALRYLGTPYCSAWKYALSGSVLTVTAKLIDYLDKNDASLGTRLTSYMNDASFWTTLNEEEGAMKRQFYAVGYRNNSSNGGTGTADGNLGTTGRYWSATETSFDNAFLLNFNTDYLFVYNYGKKWGYPIRLFRNEGLAEARTTHLTPDDIGKVLGANGKVYSSASAATSAGTTASGIIAYVGANVDVTNPSYNSLVRSLTESGAQFWYTSNGGTCVTQTSNEATAFTYLNGIDCTNTLANSNGTGVTSNCVGHTHAAATWARNYSTARPAGASQWFLASVGQWQLIAEGLASRTANLTNYGASNLNAIVTAAGGTGFRANGYWSSSEYSTTNAWGFTFYNRGGTYSPLKRYPDGYWVFAVFAY